MSSGYSGRRYQCPFFKWDERRKIHCEGGVVALPRAELGRYADRYCGSLTGWRECPIAMGLSAYYDKKE